jgi:hypothetical protein
VRYIDQRLVRGEPAQALLDTVGSDPASVIVVGNRGLGATEGQLLGSVPSEVVKNAVCDVIIVQTSAFLHVNARVQGGWTLLAYVFTAVLLVITIAGSLWIMHHLNTNMMPGMMVDPLRQAP